MEMNVPTYSLYVSGNEFTTGSVLSMAAKAAKQGDALSIEYPNHSRASGTVVSASPNEIEVEIGLEIWRLRPHAPSDGTIHNNPAGDSASFWTVQTKV